jgi:hypothetical protein
MMVCPITLALLALLIAQQGLGWLTLTSIPYFLVFGGTSLGRWLEFRCESPATGTGEPATKDRLSRYAFAASTVGVAIWLIANLVGDHINLH